MKGIGKAEGDFEKDGKIATPVPREGCAGFSGVPILASIVRIGTGVVERYTRRVRKRSGKKQGETAS
jgi:hypothetical protein